MSYFDLIMFKKCSNGPPITYLVSIPIGRLEICCCTDGLHKLNFKEINKKCLVDQHEYNLNANVFIINNENNAQETTANKTVLECIDYLNNYFNTKNNKCNIQLPKICWSSVCDKESFTERVLKALFNKIDIGQRVTYKELAILSGSNQAYRAVGSVMRKNPIPLVIPCHRVIKSDESLGNYSGGTGTDLKEWLLIHENKFINKL